MADQGSSRDPHDRADRRADQTFQRCPFEPVFEINDTDSARKPKKDRIQPPETKGLNEIRNQRQRDCKNQTHNHNIDQVVLFFPLDFRR